MKPTQHVVPHPDGWAVRKSGSHRVTAVHDTQEKAFVHARDIARCQRTELIVHGRSGRIRDKNSYGNDPFPPRG